ARRALLVLGLLWHQVVTGPCDDIGDGVGRYRFRRLEFRFLPGKPSHARSFALFGRVIGLLAEGKSPVGASRLQPVGTFEPDLQRSSWPQGGKRAGRLKGPPAELMVR